MGQGCDLCRVTVRPPLSGSPPRRLYFLGAIHRYEGPNLHHLPRGRKGRCGPGSGKRSWGLRWKHSLPALSAEAPRCNVQRSQPHNQSPLSPSKLSSQLFLRFISESMLELVPAVQGVRRPRQVTICILIGLLHALEGRAPQSPLQPASCNRR